MKEVMREADAVYGGEMSAHHYFRDFAYCDSGKIPWLLVAQLHVRVAASRCRRWSASASRSFPASGEINRKVRRREGDDRSACRSTTSRARARSISPTACRSSSTDWRFNLRSLEHRAADPPQRRKPRRRGADAREHRRAAGR